ncbi:response regulator transcription factor [Asticcacaulis endophyticus]|uniref:DNA-binding response regulator n=1 Tax=Asticcacaulis endophyticus TaxID=1395890 RepID=A0A918UXC8_9CAUL|nr:response regulator transcription factor [Asticcacaulis endophyticus]GGZ39678.1 DNA-binding response regulator [Asticcacaulis endophyticus]
MKILVVEDDVQTANFIARGLSQSGHTVDVSTDGEDGLIQATRTAYDVMIIDRMLPKCSGLELVQAVRSGHINTPVLMLTALSSVDDRVEGLESGADDYLAKPFAFTELLARVRALHRRAAAPGEELANDIHIGDLHFDLYRRRVTRAGRRIDLTPQEFKLLEYLVRRRGETITRAMLLENLWGYDFDPRTNIVEAHISRLRAKLDVPGGRPLLRTLRGFGYVIDDAD